jgi:hypothetical protein
MCVLFSLQRLSETFFILGGTERDIIEISLFVLMKTTILARF